MRSDPTTLILACGALARELVGLIRVNGWSHVKLQCLPAELHNTPGKIPGAVREKLMDYHGRYENIYVAYADCGTGGKLDEVLEEFNIDRLPGAHCYEFFSGPEIFTEMVEEEIGSFYLTDFLVRHFDRLVIKGLGIDRYPQLIQDYFGNYRRLVYLAQVESPELEQRAKGCARQLGLEYVHHWTGLDPIQKAMETSKPVLLHH